MIELQSGNEVFWTDPDEGMSSGYYFIDTILTEDGTYNSERDFDDTIISIHNESGSHAEVYVSEVRQKWGKNNGYRNLY